MNTVKFFFASFFFFFTLAMNAQTQVETNYDSTEITTPTIDVEQTQTIITLENQTSNSAKTIETNTILNNSTKTSTNTYAFSFNHKQFLKPIIRKRAYC